MGDALINDRAWMVKASCQDADPNLFFPSRGRISREARSVCAGCRVKGECLEYALEHHETIGVWGGTSWAERRAIYQERGLPELLVLEEDDEEPC